jgi:hypothetical protein
MLHYNSELTSSFFVVARTEQVVELSIEPRDQDSTAKSIATLKNELIEEKRAQEKAQADTDTLS